MMKVGRFGLFCRFDFEVRLCASSSFTPMPELPRMDTSGRAFGSEPQVVFSAMRNDGSNA